MPCLHNNIAGNHRRTDFPPMVKCHRYHPVVTTWRVSFHRLSVIITISLISPTVETRHALSTEQHRGKPPPCRFSTNGEMPPLSPRSDNMGASFHRLSVIITISLITATVETRHALSTQQHRGEPPPYRFFTNGEMPSLSPRSDNMGVLFHRLSVIITISLISPTVETRHALSTQQHRGKPPPYRFPTNGEMPSLSPRSDNMGVSFHRLSVIITISLIPPIV